MGFGGFWWLGLKGFRAEGWGLLFFLWTSGFGLRPTAKGPTKLAKTHPEVTIYGRDSGCFGCFSRFKVWADRMANASVDMLGRAIVASPKPPHLDCITA